MTTSIVKIDRTSGSVGRASAAPAPSGGTYFAEGSNNTGIAHVARLDSAGALVWTKEITISAATTANGVTPTIYSSSDHVAVVLRYFETAGSVYKTSVVLYQADGTKVWEQLVPVAISRRVTLFDATTTGGTTGLVLAEDESAYLTGTLSSNTKLALVKLNGSDGSLAWVVDLFPSTGSPNWGSEIVELGLLSGGDPVVAFVALDPSFATSETHVQRITASTGAAAWTRKVNWGGAVAGAAIAVDPSDNIYVANPADAADGISVVKFDSSGTSTWIRRANISSTTTSIATMMSATSAGLFIAHRLTTGAHGHYFVDAAGTTGTGVIALARYALAGTASFEVRGSRATGTQVLMVLTESVASVVRAAIVKSDTTTTAEDGSYGATYTRTSSTANLATSTASVTTPSYTRATAPSLTLATSAITETSGGLTATVMAPTSVCTATGLASTAAFGLPEMQGVQLPYTISTVFGTTTHGRGLYATGTAATAAFGTPLPRISYGATGLLNTTLFGLPVYSDDRTCGVTGIASTLGIGTPFSIRGGAPAPIGYASSLDPSTAFGTAAATSVLRGAATGFSSTTFGLPINRLGLTATALAPATAFGTTNAQVHANAQGLASTVFGTPKAVCLGYAASLPAATRFGLPALSNVYLCVATGWSSTVFGTPLTRWPTRTRSAKFRTQFGLAQAERTLP